MKDEVLQTVLKRKAEAGRPRPDHTAMSPAKAIRLGVPKAGQELLQIAVVVDTLVDQKLSLAELLDMPEERSMLTVLEGPMEGLGLLALSPTILTGLTEVLTMGRVGTAPVVPRRPTRTDAAMVVEFIDRLMTEIEVSLATEQDVVWAGGFRYASFLDDPRPLGLLLEDTTYRVFSLGIDMSGGLRQGNVLLALPAAGRGRPPQPKKKPANAPVDTRATEWTDAMEQSVVATTARLDVVLHRITLTLAMVQTFSPGMLVPLPSDALDHLVLEGLGGRPISTGRLGQCRGHRAVRLTEADPAGANPSALPALPDETTAVALMRPALGSFDDPGE